MRSLLLPATVLLMLAACERTPAPSGASILTANGVASMGTHEQEARCAVLTELPDTASHAAAGRNVVTLQSAVILTRATTPAQVHAGSAADSAGLPAHQAGRNAWTLIAPCIVIRSVERGSTAPGAASTTAP